MSQGPWDSAQSPPRGSYGMGATPDRTAQIELKEGPLLSLVGSYY